VDLSARFPAGDYATGHSDIVAQLVLAHQTQMHNLITLVNYKTRLAQHPRPAPAPKEGVEAPEAAPARTEAELAEDVLAAFKEPAEELVRYILFADEAPLEGPVAGTTDFAKDFAAIGPRDAEGRSLRDFDLTRRMFKYPCSYLI
jgi:hypothetical protein